MASVTTNNNPSVSIVGTQAADATILNSDGAAASYTVESIDGTETFTVNVGSDISRHTKIVALSATSMQVMLRFRTKYRFRTDETTTWTEFKTRDKNYATPHAVFQHNNEVQGSAWTAAPSKSNQTINVSNTGKATTVNTATGATVTNTDNVYAGTTSITNTATGATVRTDSF